MKKIAYIIPGFYQQVSDKNYVWILEEFRKNDFEIVQIHISWKYTSIEDWILEFLSQTTAHKPWDMVSVFWFSYGAMIAFLSAKKLQPDILFLASLSPYFSEDLDWLKKWWKTIIGIRRLKAFSNIYFQREVNYITSKTYLFAGVKECHNILQRTAITHDALKNSDYIIVPDAKHDIAHKNYISALGASLRTIQ